MTHCKKEENQHRANSMAESLITNGNADFWKEVKKVTNSKVSISNTIDDTSGTEDIANMWADHYKLLFNSVNPDKYNKKDLYDIEYDSNMCVHIDEITEEIKNLPNGKSPGLDQLMAEHIKFASPRISVLFALLFSSLFVHRIMPLNMIKSVLVPIIKNKSGDLSSKNNYRPIGLSSVCSKLLEKIMLRRITSYIDKNDNQFGFKEKHSTETCIFVLKEILHYFKRHSTTSFVCFMDASKAFDRVNHGKLFNILMKRKIPNYLICMIEFWLNQQLLCVRWGDKISEFFKVHNGVRQGGILSPLLFNIYFDVISDRVKQCGTGCYFNGLLINHLMYADDIVLFSPSAKGLQSLVNCCVDVGDELDIKFNELKTEYMIIYSKQDKQCDVNLPEIYIHGDILQKVTGYKYLGHYITDDMCDNKDILRQIQCNYAKGNMLCRNFGSCTDDVKCMLFKTFLYNMYTVSLWCNFSQLIYNKLVVSYNNIFRFLFQLPRYCSARTMFVESRIKSFNEILRTVAYSLMRRIYMAKDNGIIYAFMNSPARAGSILLKRLKELIY